MKHLSHLDKKKYLYALRMQMRAWSDFGRARFTGLICGRFFYITNHSQYEWDRRYSHVKCRAFGFVTERGGETLVRAMCTYGLFDPVSLLMFFLFSILFGFLFYPELPLPVLLSLAAVIPIFPCAGSALGTWFTDRGQENMAQLRALLEDPTQFEE